VIGRVRWTEHGGNGEGEHTDSIEIERGVFVFAIVVDMDSACGRDNEGSPRYLAEAKLVDLGEIDDVQADQALYSCGFYRTPEGIVSGSGDVVVAADDPRAALVLAEVCMSYGLYAPMGSEFVGSCAGDVNSRSGAPREARRVARRMARAMLDGRERERKLSEPVNAIGSTAAEVMCGDIDSAILRGLANGDPRADLLARMGTLRRDA